MCIQTNSFTIGSSYTRLLKEHFVIANPQLKAAVIKCLEPYPQNLCNSAAVCIVYNNTSLNIISRDQATLMEDGNEEDLCVPSLFSVSLRIRFSSSIWNYPFNHSCFPNKRLMRDRVNVD